MDIIKKEYSTDNKKIVTEFFYTNKEQHYTVEHALDDLSENGVDIPKSTLYRIIGNLCKKGILKRYESPTEDRFVYQYANFGESCSDHFHLKCTECGMLIHLECEKMREIKEHIMNEHGFLIGGNGIINGICGKCLMRKNEKNCD